MAYPAIKQITPGEYLAMERNAGEKHEYYDGEIVAMAGAGERHNRIVANLIGELHGFLKGKECNVYPSDFRVTTPLFSAYMYPDVSIVCGDTEMQEETFDTLVNPAVIIEVLSPSTESRDTGYKFFRYLQIPSLKEYIMIDTNACMVKTIVKQDDGSFKVIDTQGMAAALTIYTIGMQLPLKDIYYRVSFAG